MIALVLALDPSALLALDPFALLALDPFALLAQEVGLSAGITTEVVLFVVFGALAVGAGIAMVSMRNMVHGALMLVVNMLAIAGLYLVLESAFLSVVQVIVYAGAVMVLFLFVIMLLGVDRDDLLVEVRPATRGAAVLAGLVVVGILGYGLVGPYTTAGSTCPTQAGDVPATQPGAVRCVGLADTVAAAEGGGVGSVEVVAAPLFTRWTFPFEVAALLLTVATLGAMLLGRRNDPDPDDDPAWEPSMRVDDPDHPTGGHLGAPVTPTDTHGDLPADQGDPDDRSGDRDEDADAPVPASVGPVASDDERTGDTTAGEGG